MELKKSLDAIITTESAANKKEIEALSEKVGVHEKDVKDLYLKYAFLDDRLFKLDDAVYDFLKGFQRFIIGECVVFAILIALLYFSLQH